VVVVKGVLRFDGGNKLTMPCDSRIYIMGGGKLTSDGGGNSNRIEICASVLWSGSSGNISGPSCLPTNLPGCSLVMPIELTSFEVTQCSSKMCISWTTATEKNNDYFVVQKLVGDVFVDMKKVDSKSVNGNSKHQLNYSVQDDEPVTGVNYYRLKQVDTDGSYSTSRIVVVNFTGSKKNIEAFPNPSSGNFTLKLFAGALNEIHILDSNGTVVINEQVMNADQYQVTNLSTGIYFCVVKSMGTLETLKMVVR